MDEFQRVADSWKKHRAADLKTPKSSFIHLKDEHSPANLKVKKRKIKFARKMEEQNSDILESEEVVVQQA